MKVKILFFFLVTVFLATSCTRQHQKIESDVSKNTQIARNIPFQELLGPLAPIAISPFFGLTLTSGASLLANHGMFQENSFLTTNNLLANYWIFGILLLLTLITSFPNMFKSTKWFGLIVSYIEDYSTLICLLIIVILPFMSDKEMEIVQQAGIINLSYSVLLAIAVAINYFVIQSVRYFFELLIFICPFPFVDGILESTKKATSGTLYSIYLISPWLAFALNVFLFLIALILFARARRNINYYSDIFVKPRLLEYFGIEKSIVDIDVAYRYKKQFQVIDFCIPVYLKKRKGRYPAKTKIWFMMADEQLFLVKPRFFRKPELTKITPELHGQLFLGTDYFYKTIYNNKSENKLVMAVSKTYINYIDVIVNKAKISDGGVAGAKKMAAQAKEKIKLKWSQLKDWFKSEDLLTTETSSS